jgi:hypothetical protein
VVPSISTSNAFQDLPSLRETGDNTEHYIIIFIIIIKLQFGLHQVAVVQYSRVQYSTVQ